MSKQLDALVATMVAYYGDLNLFAKAQIVDAKDVADSLAKAKPDSAEAICLKALASFNPYTPPPAE